MLIGDRIDFVKTKDDRRFIIENSHSLACQPSYALTLPTDTITTATRPPPLSPQGGERRVVTHQEQCGGLYVTMLEPVGRERRRCDGQSSSCVNVQSTDYRRDPKVYNLRRYSVELRLIRGSVRRLNSAKWRKTFSYSRCQSVIQYSTVQRCLYWLSLHTTHGGWRFRR